MQFRFQVLIGLFSLFVLPVLPNCPAFVRNGAEVLAQSPPHRSFSFRAKPKSSCAVYLVTEVGLLVRMVNSQKTTDLYHRDGTHSYGEDFGVRFGGQGNVGLMFNVSRTASLGVIGFGVVEEHRPRAGVKLRYRFWEWVGTAIDLEGGMAVDLATDEFSKDLDRRQWLVAGLSLSHTQFVHFVFQLESWLQDYPPNRRTSAAYIGLRFGY